MFSVFLFATVDSLVLGLSQAMNQLSSRLQQPYSLQFPYQEQDTLLNKLKNNSEKNIKFVTSTEFEGLLSVEEGAYHSVLVKSWQTDLHGSQNNPSIQYFFSEDVQTEEDFQNYTLGHPIIIGEALYERLGLLAAEELPIKLINPVADIGPSGDFEPASQLFYIVGLYSLDRKQIEERTVFILPKNIHELGQKDFMQNQVSLIGPEASAKEFTQKWNHSELGLEYPFQHWKDQNPLLSKALQLEKLIYRILFFVLILIACFNSISVSTLFVHEKAQDMTVLRFLGLTTHHSKLVFAFLAGALGLLGSVFGLTLAATLVFVVKNGGVELPQAYGFTQIPILFSWQTAGFLFIFVPGLNALFGYLISHGILSLKFKQVLLKT